jgi:hypothetical protein
MRSDNYSRRIPALKRTLIFPIKDLRLSHEGTFAGTRFAAQNWLIGGFCHAPD